MTLTARWVKKKKRKEKGTSKTQVCIAWFTGEVVPDRSLVLGFESVHLNNKP